MVNTKMNNEEKLNIIEYLSYKNNDKKWNSNQTKEFFDLDFSKLLHENAFEISNSQVDLLSFFDMSEIFNEFNNQINDTQKNLLKFFVIKKVKNVSSLLNNMPDKLELEFFYECYRELCNTDNRPFWFSNVINCLKEQDVVKFVNATINEVSDEEIIFMIRDLYENKKDSLLKELMMNARISDIAVRRINAPFFYEMVEDLKLPNSLLEKRELESQNVITNYQDYEINEVKEAFCDLHLHNTLNNALLDIKTIVDFANDDSVFKDEYLAEAYHYICKMYNILNNNDELSTSDIDVLNSNPINYILLSKCYLMSQKRFKDLISESVNKSITDNIEPKILLSSSGKKVNIYNIENQTEKQKNVTMLVSTIPCSDNALEFKKNYYSDNNAEIKNNRRSCSLINESKLSSLFGGKNRITFGYEDLNGRVITSATLGDGRTDGNEERFRKSRRVSKSSYSSINKFIAGTQGHNEVTVNMGELNEVMNPSYILITREEPTQFEIDVAAEFNIPIKYVNINKYEQAPDNDYKSEDYNYVDFSKKEVISKKERLNL